LVPRAAELVILKNMGHMFDIEAEDEANRIMLDFFRRHRTSGWILLTLTVA
jgi:pimeloyl-ACP methyl ester carboxylesterase